MSHVLELFTEKHPMFRHPSIVHCAFSGKEEELMSDALRVATLIDQIDPYEILPAFAKCKALYVILVIMVNAHRLNPNDLKDFGCDGFGLANVMESLFGPVNSQIVDDPGEHYLLKLLKSSYLNGPIMEAHPASDLVDEFGWLCKPPRQDGDKNAICECDRRAAHESLRTFNNRGANRARVSAS